MAEETKETARRTRVKDLPRKEKELPAGELKRVKGGAFQPGAEQTSLEPGDGTPGVENIRRIKCE